MDELTSQPDTDLVYSLFEGVYKPHLLRLAIQVDIFTPLATGPLTAEAVARVINCHPYGTRALLDYLCSLQVIACQGDLYDLTVTAQTFLVRGTKSYVGDLILHDTGPAMFDLVLRALRTGKHTSLAEYFDQDAWLESYRTRRIQSSLILWEMAGITAQLDVDISILDIGCGCAIKSLVLAQKTPRAHITCLDAPNVLVVARDLAERMEVLPQVRFVPADLLTTDLGTAQYDAVLTGQITHYLSETENIDLFHRIYQALTPDGVYVIDCPMSTDNPSQSASFLTLMLWANSGGTAYSFETYREWLMKVGFIEVKRLGERWLSASR